MKTIINCSNARAMFWVKIKTVFNLNFIPQAINPDVYCWFFKIFYVNTEPGHALFICSELLEFSLVSNHPQSSAYFISLQASHLRWFCQTVDLSQPSADITSCFIMTLLFYVNVWKKCQKCQPEFAYKWGMQTHKIYHN